MYRIFSKPIASLGMINNFSIPRIKSLVMDHYNYQMWIYQRYGTYLHPDHILIRLLYVLNEYISEEMDTYRVIEDCLVRICSGLRITSNYNSGEIHKHSFYTDNCAIIATTFTDDITDISWELLRPVRCLNHPNTSLELHIPPTNKNDFNSFGVAVVGIDIPMLGYQFKCWNRINSFKPEVERESLAIYIVKIILPNMIPEQFDIAMRNRLPYICNGIIPPKSERERSFVVSYEDSLDNMIGTIIKTINRTRESYKRGLMSIPFVFGENYLDAVPREINSLSTYSYWVVLLTYIDWVYPLCFIIESEQKNITDISKILVRVERFINSTNCLRYMPDNIKRDFDIKYNKIKEVFK